MKTNGFCKVFENNPYAERRNAGTEEKFAAATLASGGPFPRALAASPRPHARSNRNRNRNRFPGSGGTHSTHSPKPPIFSGGIFYPVVFINLVDPVPKNKFRSSWDMKHISI